jgi:hypothetical protein
LWLVLFSAYAATLGLHARDGSRYTAAEAHVLLTAESLASDGDLDLRDEYRTRAWSDWYPGSLRPTAGLTGGRLLEPQGAGFPLLIAPAYALGGPTAVELWIAAVTALGFVLAAALGRRLVPEPWPSAAALVAGLSPPALAAATTVGPGTTAGAVIAGAAVLALRVREAPRLRRTAGAAALVAVLPWLGPKFLLAAAVLALALYRWLRRRQRALAGFVALELILVSAVVYVTVNDRLYAGLTPYAARLPDGPPTGAESAGDYLERAPRLLGVWLDRDAGLLVWAPFAAIAAFALWLLWHSRRERLAVAVADQVDVEVTAAFLVLLCAAAVGVAAFGAPSLHGAWLVQPELLPALPAGAALAAWGLRHAPRAGAALAALTLVASIWLLAGARLDDGAGLAPPRGALPWGGAERALPLFGDDG